jgi:hypothetical protein
MQLKKAANGSSSVATETAADLVTQQKRIKQYLNSIFKFQIQKIRDFESII